MTLPEVPKWKTRVHSTTEQSSGTRWPGISFPGEEATYAPSIQKMIRPPRQFMARARSQRQQEQTKQCPKRRKQVETRSKSTIKASQRKEKASEKMRRSRPREKRSRRPPKTRDKGCRMTCLLTKRRTKRDHKKSTEKSTEPQWQSTNDFCLSRRWSNELPKGGWSCWKCVLPTGRDARRDAFYWDMHWEVDWQIVPSRPRFYWRCLCGAHLWSRLDGHRSGLP